MKYYFNTIKLYLLKKKSQILKHLCYVEVKEIGRFVLSTNRFSCFINLLGFKDIQNAVIIRVKRVQVCSFLV